MESRFLDLGWFEIARLLLYVSRYVQYNQQNAVSAPSKCSPAALPSSECSKNTPRGPSLNPVRRGPYLEKIASDRVKDSLRSEAR